MKNPGFVINFRRVIVEREREIAFESPDYLHPEGTRKDNSRNLWFNRKLRRLFPDGRQLRILDLGCSGGGFVKSCLEDGHLAVGLEGSDFSRRYKRAEWGSIPDFLFTCDITRPFRISIETDKGTTPLLFDFVTCWEVMEHIAEADLAPLAENVRRHLLPGGLWIVSVGPNEEVVGGVKLHQTVKPRGWWMDKFQSMGFRHLPQYLRYFNTQFVRGPKQGAPGSFHLVLCTETNGLPRIPRVGIAERLLDWWFGSFPQRVLRTLVMGDLR